LFHHGTPTGRRAEIGRYLGPLQIDPNNAMAFGGEACGSCLTHSGFGSGNNDSAAHDVTRDLRGGSEPVGALQNFGTSVEEEDLPDDVVALEIQQEIDQFGGSA
jgi:hypothetical protein